jgi:hypothetical protein
MVAPLHLTITAVRVRRARGPTLTEGGLAPQAGATPPLP